MKIPADQWATVSSLLDEALDLDADARPSWLERLATREPQIGAVVKRLLETHAKRETADVLATLPRLHLTATSALPTAALAAGERVGPYQLLRELGSGGMAHVWLARRDDGAFIREVALKIPQLSRLRRDLAERFARERDILARLEHPNIARLYDAGVSADGLPYLAMEYVDGQPITAWCDSQRLDVTQRLRLFRQVLDAVQFAHSHLVIHRDLKPSNILVTADGQVRLLDFGIAKLLADDAAAQETQLTQLSGRALTPDYASPEQIKGEPLTIASDVYSLGVVLYELLAGNRPYKLKLQSAAQLELAILEAESAAPSRNIAETASAARLSTTRQLARLLEGDLDTIALKALAKAPLDRYGTIAAFADDLQRFHDGRPVAATAPSHWYRARKFVARNKLAVGASATVAVALLAAALVSTWQAQRARDQARLAEQAVGRHEAVRQLYVELLSSITGWDAKTFSQPRSIGTLLEQKLEELQPQYATRPQEWAGILNAASVQFSFMGDAEAARKTARQYLDVLKQTRADTRSIVYAHMSVSRALRSLGRPAESEAILRDGLNWIPASSDPQLLAIRLALVSDLGTVLPLNGKRAEAKTLLAQMRVAAQKQFAGERDFATLLQIMARIELGFDDRAALELIENAQRVFLASGRAEIGEIGPNQFHLGSAYLELGRLAEAEVALSESHAKLAQLYGAADHDTLAALGRLASVLNRQQRYAEAAALLLPALDGLRDKSDKRSRAIDAALRGRMLEGAMLAGDVDAAERIFSTIAAPDARDASVHDQLVLPLARIQQLLWTGRVQQAHTQLERLRASAPSGLASAENHRVELAAVQILLASGAKNADDKAAALLQTLNRDGATHTWTFVVARECAALAAAAAGKTDRALELLPEINNEDKQTSIPAPSVVERMDSQLRRARVLVTLGHRDGAAALARSAQSALAGQHPSSPRLGQARAILAAADTGR